MAKRELTQLIQTEINKAVARIEQAMNAEIPHTGGRVLYVALPGRGRNRANLTARARQVLRFLARQRQATSAALQSALRVNRNVIAGAIHELKQAGMVKTRPVS